MKAKKVTIAVLFVLLINLMFMMFFTGCSTYNPDKFATMSFEEFEKENWDEKEIEYQFLSYDPAEFSFSGNYAIMANCYTDGSVKVWQGFNYDIKDRVYADKAHNIYFIYYGYWEKSEEGGVTTISMHKFCNDDTIMSKEMLAEDGQEKYEVTVFDNSKNAERFEKVEDTANENRFYVLSSATAITNTNSEYVMVHCDGTVYYNNVDEFYNVWKDQIIKMGYDA